MQLLDSVKVLSSACRDSFKCLSLGFKYLVQHAKLLDSLLDTFKCLVLRFKCLVQHATATQFPVLSSVSRPFVGRQFQVLIQGFKCLDQHAIAAEIQVLSSACNC